jgi:hypothetical protein
VGPMYETCLCHYCRDKIFRWLVEVWKMNTHTHTHTHTKQTYSCVISGFRREIDKDFALLCYYAASSGNFLTTFRNMSFLSFGVKNLEDLLGS